MKLDQDEQFSRDLDWAMSTSDFARASAVLDSLAASLFVEEQTGVRHESPQVLAMQNGTTFAHALHREITLTFLEKLHKD